MKNLLLLFILLISCSCQAQNYQCFRTDTINYFTNSNGYLRGIRIDSVRTDELNSATTIYYPYHTPRGQYLAMVTLDSNGGSWLGKKVIEQQDGTYLFDNMWGDTVVIKTQAQPGDSWTFFDDTTAISYKATLTKVDTMTILGNPDSIKVITIEADSNGILNTADSINGFQIILSKNKGLVQVFDLYTFPYHRPGNIRDNMFIDYYLDIVLGYNTSDGNSIMDFRPSLSPNALNSIFRIVSFHNPSQMEINNYEIGDVFEYYNSSSITNGYNYSTFLDSILDKSIAPYSITYKVASKSQTGQSSQQGSSVSPVSYTINSNVVYDTQKVFYFQSLPEEWNYEYRYYFTYSQRGVSLNDYSCPIVNYAMFTSQISPNGTLQFIGGDGGIFFDYDYVAYGIGYGEVESAYRHTYAFDPGTANFANFSGGELTYSLKAGESCGSYSNFAGIKNTERETILSLYPNPVYDILTISSQINIKSIILTDLFGRTVFNGQYNSEKVQIDVSALASGMYMVRINDTVVRKLVKR